MTTSIPLRVFFATSALKKHLGKRRELMERTTKFFLLDDTSKALKNQVFSEKQFQSGHSFSSQPRYDHFDTAAYLRWDLTAAHHFIEYLIPGGMSIPSLPRPVFKKPPPPDSAAKLELTANRLYNQTRQAIIYGGMRCEHAYAGNRTPDFKKVHATRYGHSFPDFVRMRRPCHGKGGHDILLFL